MKGSTQAIRRSLREGLLGDAGNVHACRTKIGPFEQVRSYPEFRDLVVPVPQAPDDALGPPPLPSEFELALHIDLGQARPQGPDWIKWLFLIFVALVTAAVTFFLMTAK